MRRENAELGMLIARASDGGGKHIWLNSNCGNDKYQNIKISKYQNCFWFLETNFLVMILILIFFFC